MKRTVVFTSSLVVISLIWFGCSKEASTSTELDANRDFSGLEKSTSINLGSVPGLHNDFLIWYYTTDALPDLDDTRYSSERFGSVLSIREAKAAAYCEYYLAEVRNFTIDPLFTEEDFIDLADFLAIVDDQRLKGYPSCAQFDSLFRVVTRSLQFDEGLYSFFNEVYEKGQDGVSTQDFVNFINQYSDEDISSHDEAFFELFKGQANASLYLWTHPDSPLGAPERGNCPPFGWKCGTWVVAVDALGGVVGCVFGGVGAIISGGILSGGASEECDCNHCPC